MPPPRSAIIVGGSWIAKGKGGDLGFRADPVSWSMTPQRRLCSSRVQPQHQVLVPVRASRVQSRAS
eukprot:7027682-Pyramimonas_sp.AAC.1